MERMKLYGEEYYAILQVYGAFNALLDCESTLEKRLRSTNWGWQNYRIVRGLALKLMRTVLSTIPSDRLAKMETEIKHAHCEVNVKQDFTGSTKPQMFYVPGEPLERIMERIMEYECGFCEKRGAECGACGIRKDFNACCPWDVAEVEGGVCTLSGNKKLLLKENENNA